MGDDFNEVGVCRAKVGSQCCDSLSVSGKYFANGNYAKTNEVYNNKPVYRHDGGNWCIFYGGFWKIENCDWLERGDDNSQGFAWSRVYEECPQHIGAQWRYFNFGGAGFSGLNGFTAQGQIDRSIDVICACEGGKTLCSLALVALNVSITSGFAMASVTAMMDLMKIVSFLSKI